MHINNLNGTRDGTKYSSSTGFNQNNEANGFMHYFRTNNTSPMQVRPYVNQGGKEYNVGLFNKS